MSALPSRTAATACSAVPPSLIEIRSEYASRSGSVVARHDGLRTRSSDLPGTKPLTALTSGRPREVQALAAGDHVRAGGDEEASVGADVSRRRSVTGGRLRGQGRNRRGVREREAGREVAGRLDQVDDERVVGGRLDPRDRPRLPAGERRVALDQRVRRVEDSVDASGGDAGEPRATVEPTARSSPRQAADAGLRARADCAVRADRGLSGPEGTQAGPGTADASEETSLRFRDVSTARTV
jgi:hypothetical protein